MSTGLMGWESELCKYNLLMSWSQDGRESLVMDHHLYQVFPYRLVRLRVNSEIIFVRYICSRLFELGSILSGVPFFPSNQPSS